MLVEDWRAASAADVGSLLECERDRWKRVLAWDPAEAWRCVEDARCAGTLPGFLVREAGTVTGWTFFIVHDGVLKIGALQGESADVVRRLLEAILHAPETRFASEYQCFLFPGHSSVEAALARRRFALDRHAYLERALGSTTHAARANPQGALRAWMPSDLPGVVRLLARAYGGDIIARCFAPHGRLDEWAAYVSQVVHGTALGRFEPACSWVSTAGSSSHPQGALMATWVAPETLHVVQLAVDPDARGRGLGRQLVEAAIGSAAGHGAARVTLLAAASNAAARGLYRALGFTERSTFLFGWRERPTRVLQARRAGRSTSALLQEAG